MLYIAYEGIITNIIKSDSSARFIKAPAIAMQTLREYCHWQAKKHLEVGDRWVDCDRLFTHDNDEPIHQDTIGCWFRDFDKTNDLSDISIHSLRHINTPR